jgi:hypothetical protein
MDQKPPRENPDEWTRPGTAAPGGQKKKPLSPTPPGAPQAFARTDAVANNGSTQGDATGKQGSGQSSTTQCFSILGIGDRAHHMAMAHGTPKATLNPSLLESKKAIGKIRPTSRSECARARGAKNFCDPSHPASCGGKFCGMPLSARQGTDFI